MKDLYSVVITNVNEVLARDMLLDQMLDECCDCLLGGRVAPAAPADGAPADGASNDVN